MTPIGWQNLSSIRHRTRNPGEILSAVQDVYPGAVEETLADDILLYWLDASQSRLIGLAWRDPRFWSYVIMSKVAFDMGSLCWIYPIDENGRFRILPQNGNRTPTIRRQIQSAQARLKRVRERRGATPQQCGDAAK